MDMARPKVCQVFKAPAHKGSEGRVTGVDFVGTVGSLSADYSITTYVINARNATLFPRLSAIASVWRRYYPKMLRFHLFGIAAATQRGYTSMSSLITDDLSTTVNPDTEQEILNQENVAIGRPWSYVTHDVNLGGLGLKWYSTDTTDGSGPGEYIGRAFLGIPQTTTDSDIEVQVYVEYDVEFCQRIASGLIATPAPPEERISGGQITGGGTIATSNILGTAAFVDNQSQGVSIDSSGVITMENGGTYLVAAIATGTSLGPIISANFVSTLASQGDGSVTMFIGRALNLNPNDTIGPFTIDVGTPSSTTVYLARVPPDSITALQHPYFDRLYRDLKLRQQMRMEAKPK